MLLCMSNMLVLGCKKDFSTEAVHTCFISQGHYFYNLYDFKYVIVGQTLPGKRKLTCTWMFSLNVTWFTRVVC